MKWHRKSRAPQSLICCSCSVSLFPCPFFPFRVAIFVPFLCKAKNAQPVSLPLAIRCSQQFRDRTPCATCAQIVREMAHTQTSISMLPFFLVPSWNFLGVVPKMTKTLAIPITHTRVWCEQALVAQHTTFSESKRGKEDLASLHMPCMQNEKRSTSVPRPHTTTSIFSE